MVTNHTPDTAAEFPGDVLTRLHAGLRERRTPQQVAADLVELGADGWLPEQLAYELRQLARYAGDRHEMFAVGSSMSTTWRRHPGLPRAYAAAAAAMRSVTTAANLPSLEDADATDPTTLQAWVSDALRVLGLPTAEPAAARRPNRVRTREVTEPGGWYGNYTYTMPMRPKGRRGDRGGHADARARMDATTRKAQLPGVSVRTYRRAVRAVLHLQQRTTVLAHERDREAATALGKARLAHTITAEAFASCAKTAAFVAYYAARLGVRTRFTSSSQDRPMDTVAEGLLTAALAADTCRADVIARVLTRQAVLRRLTDTERGQLLGVYYEQLAACSRALRRTFDPKRDRTHMIVRRGDDLSTWNVTSRAFNQARTGWLNLAQALGLADVVADRCPGKVPALVAADVARWHTLDGGGQHADIAVWAQLPLPWAVILDGVDCPASLVRQVCATHGLDADETGWTSAYRQDGLETPQVAPDLVHGVVVASPLLAGILRAAGVASGQAPTEVQQQLLATVRTTTANNAS